MQYQEYAVPTRLRRHVQCVWTLRDPDPDIGSPQTIYPDGRCELIVHRGTPMDRFELDRGWSRQHRVLFAGQLRTAIRLAPAGPLDCLGVRLTPAVSDCIGQRPVAEFQDQVADLQSIDAALADRLSNAADVFSSDQGASLWELLETYLLPCSIDPQIEAAIVRLEDAFGQTRISTLASESSMSLRSFQTRFLSAVGLTAKEFGRVVRLQATLHALDQGGTPLAQLAIDAGFSDQSHATRELNRLTGLTPAKLSEALHADRHHDQTIRLAAAFVRGRS